MFLSGKLRKDRLSEYCNYAIVNLMSNQKGSLLLYITIGFVLIGIIGGSLYMLNKKFTKTQDHQVQSIKVPSASSLTVDNIISDQKALEIARENGYQSDDLTVGEGFILKSTGPTTLESIKTIRITSCSLNKTMHLEPQTGQVLEFKSEVWCGGMP